MTTPSEKERVIGLLRLASVGPWPAFITHHHIANRGMLALGASLRLRGFSYVIALTLRLLLPVRPACMLSKGVCLHRLQLHDSHISYFFYRA